MLNRKRKIGSILFVCTGNSCRSVMAEGLMRKKLYEMGMDDIEVRSAGVRALSGLSPTHDTIAVMKEADVDVSEFKTKNVTRDIIKKSDLILVMEPEHKDEVLNADPEARDKTFLLKEYMNPSRVMPEGFSIHDPIGKGIEEYRKTRDDIIIEIERIAEKI